MPALLREAAARGVDPTTTAIPFGSTNELRLLDDFFVLPRPPDPDRPFRAPWSGPGVWQKRKYPGGSLQRLRTDWSGRGRLLRQQKAQPADLWTLMPDAGQELQSLSEGRSVRLVDLALWFARDRDFADVDALMAWFTSEFQPDRGDLIGTIYEDGVPAELQAVPFDSEPFGEATEIQLGSLAPAPSLSLSLGELVVRLERRVRDGGFQLPDGLVGRVLTAWLCGELVVLVGQPGTGKTMFATLLGQGLQAELELDSPLVIPVRADFDEAEFIGYERLDGNLELRDFAREILTGDEQLEARVVILEEFNLSSIEAYLASVLVATQEAGRLIRLPNGERAHLPIDTFFIATCNSYRDEPETRTRVSAPTKRRSTTITMPNVLGDLYESDPDSAVRDLLIPIIGAECDKVAARLEAHAGTRFDGIRLSRLESVSSIADLQGSTVEALVSISASILDSVPGRSWFTMGLLRDVVLHVAMADRDAEAELRALGESVADKLVHQLRGTHSDAQDLMAACADLPNADEIAHLIERSMDGPSEELLPLI